MNRDNRNDHWNEKRGHYQQDDQYSNWQNTNHEMDKNWNRGSNYAAGTFSGMAYGRGLTEDNYRGYNNTGNMQGNFANNYNAAYGDQWNNREDNSDHQQNRRPLRDIPGNGNIRRRDEHYDRSSQRPGAYNSDYDFQGQEDSRSGMERLSGGHRGKGPRGYHRSDERIQEDVNDRLSDDSYVDASGIDVKVENGTIILSGHVPDKQAKRRAEDIAESVRGVTNVENRLHIGEGMMENAAKAFISGIGDVSVGNDREKR